MHRRAGRRVQRVLCVSTRQFPPDLQARPLADGGHRREQQHRHDQIRQQRRCGGKPVRAAGRSAGGIGGNFSAERHLVCHLRQERRSRGVGSGAFGGKFPLRWRDACSLPPDSFEKQTHREALPLVRLQPRVCGFAAFLRGHSGGCVEPLDPRGTSGFIEAPAVYFRPDPETGRSRAPDRRAKRLLDPRAEIRG